MKFDLVLWANSGDHIIIIINGFAQSDPEQNPIQN